MTLGLLAGGAAIVAAAVACLIMLASVVLIAITELRRGRQKKRAPLSDEGAGLFFELATTKDREGRARAGVSARKVIWAVFLLCITLACLWVAAAEEAPLIPIHLMVLGLSILLLARLVRLTFGPLRDIALAEWHHSSLALDEHRAARSRWEVRRMTEFGNPADSNDVNQAQGEGR